MKRREKYRIERNRIQKDNDRARRSRDEGHLNPHYNSYSTILLDLLIGDEYSHNTILHQVEPIVASNGDSSFPKEKEVLNDMQFLNERISRCKENRKKRDEEKEKRIRDFMMQQDIL